MIALFDLDGTLTDPKTGITRSVQHALERLGRPVLEADALTWMIGPPLAAGFAKLLGGSDEVQDAVRLYRERYSEVGLFENEVYAGIPALLQDLRDRDVRLFVATSKLQVFARRILDHFGLSGFFHGIYGSEPDHRNADKSDLIRFILDRERIDPAQAVMIGDREYDAIGARANGLSAIGITWGYGSRQELLDAGVACLVDEPEGLKEPIVTLTASTPRRAAGA
ncbi:phosphoglycolate phosphatase [Microvirga flocculans]|uniref:Phosphoglycolate phosphatase n=1 Tax=Microvirga flocculans TaxID=217168 RepID=A0A7W6II59_9HYPH|nr:HAD family hydrolase [Microvirga flocculans]MBB4041354.1 phosphoglycolate phosphatase [Microvirga flocculans]